MPGKLLPIAQRRQQPGRLAIGSSRRLVSLHNPLHEQDGIDLVLSWAITSGCAKGARIELHFRRASNPCRRRILVWGRNALGFDLGGCLGGAVELSWGFAVA